MDELMSINLGADDFITKPYNTQILLARIASILRRVSGSNTQDTISYNDLKLNLSVNVTRLRKKLQEVGMKENIETRRGLGYILP